MKVAEDDLQLYDFMTVNADMVVPRLQEVVYLYNTFAGWHLYSNMWCDFLGMRTNLSDRFSSISSRRISMRSISMTI